MQQASALDRTRDARVWRKAARRWGSAAGLALALWTGVELWAITLNLLRGYVPPWSDLPGIVLGTLVASVLSLAWYALILRIQHWRWADRMQCAGLAALACSFAFTLSLHAIQQMAPVTMHKGEGVAFFVWQGLYWLLPFSLWCLAVLVLEGARQAHWREARLSTALLAAREAEIRALHYQINPHFLHNTLNAISTLILDRRNAEAERLVMWLSAFFRASLATDPLRDVRLGDEIAQQRLYLDIEQVRFFDRLRVVVDLPPELEDARIPSLVLQPLVENAVKHGVHAPGRETLIELRARAEGDALVVRVTDNGPGHGAAAGAGVGLDNVRRRLAARFGERGRIEAHPAPAGGFTATLILPLEFGAT